VWVEAEGVVERGWSIPVVSIVIATASVHGCTHLVKYLWVCTRRCSSCAHVCLVADVVFVAAVLLLLLFAFTRVCTLHVGGCWKRRIVSDWHVE
jgi:hypothetical protein